MIQCQTAHRIRTIADLNFLHSPTLFVIVTPPSRSVAVKYSESHSDLCLFTFSHQVGHSALSSFRSSHLNFPAMSQTSRCARCARFGMFLFLFRCFCAERRSFFKKRFWCCHMRLFSCSFCQEVEKYCHQETFKESNDFHRKSLHVAEVPAE